MIPRSRRELAAALFLLAFFCRPVAFSQEPIDIQVPPDHWAYTTLMYFSELGLLQEHPPFEFQGSRVFTRREIGVMTADLADQVSTREEFLDPDNRAKLEDLVQEFQVELAEVGRPVSLPLPIPRIESKPTTAAPSSEIVSLPKAPRLWPEISLTNSVRFGVKEDDANSASNLFSAKVSLGALNLFLSGEADNSDRESVDLKLGNHWAMELTRNYLEYTRRRGPDNKLLAFRLGDVSSINYAEGLTVGSQTIRGLSTDVEWSDFLATRAFWGRDDTREIGGADLSMKFSPRLAAGATWIRGETDSNEDSSFHGYNAQFQTDSVKVVGEYSQGDKNGHGSYIGARISLNPDWLLRTEYHYYRNFDNPFGNPPLYLGVSGGDDANERGSFISFQYKFSPKYTLIFSRDTAWQFEESALFRDTYQQLKARIGNKAFLTFSRERESGLGESILIHTVRLNKRWSSGLDLSADWKQELKSSGDTSTMALRLRQSLLEQKLTMTFDYTRRKTTTGTQRTPQVMFNYKLAANHNLSLRGSFPGGEEPYRLDLLLMSKL